MIRLATDDDIPTLITLLLAMKATSGWANEYEALNDDLIRIWVTERLHHARNLCVVWAADDDRVTAFCGVTLNTQFHPPYVLYMHEWGWYGPPKQAARCWRHCTIWGKKHGAVYGYRGTNEPTLHPRRITERTTWEKL